ncbi:Lar family restriction alleviation protein [Aureimonas glaciei]|uniref:Lar family restriction alleviation protein n=1 Tax=Aureimonas glaciei TaxID=1776957 RepID=UPI003571300A
MEVGLMGITRERTKTGADVVTVLLPCPFCGGEACRRSRESWPKTHWIQCRSCRARGPDGLLVADDAERGWNARALSDKER